MTATTTATALLFAYGTLLQDAGNEMAGFLRQRASVVSSGYIHGRLYDLGDYPGAVSAAPNETDKVYGQVYRLQQVAETLAVLDAYEEYGPGFEEPYLFVRELVEVCCTDGSKRWCWVYLYNQAVASEKRIWSGDYMGYACGLRF